MKKHFFYLALAVLSTMCTIACSSDDDEDGDSNKVPTVNLSTPPFAQQAVRYELNPELKASASTGDITTAPALKAIELSESGKILLELHNAIDNKLVYIMEEATVSGDTYTMNGTKVKGTIKKASANARTRANDQLTTDLRVTIADGETLTYDTDEEETVNVTTTTYGNNGSGSGSGSGNNNSGSGNNSGTGSNNGSGSSNNGGSSVTATHNLVRTWNVLGTILDLKSKSKNVKAYEEFDSRGGLFYLEDVLEEALRQDVKLTEKEQEEFKRVVKHVTFTQSGLFIISYVDGTEDVARWQWANSQQTLITMKLMDEEMGNKFISDDTVIEVAFNGNRCNLKCETALTDNENNDWESTLILKLQE